MENNELNKRVLERLEQKIAIAEFKEAENKKKTNTNFISLSKVASAFIVTGVLASNIYTYATYNTNVFSWVLNKFGIFEDYDKESNEVNVTKVNNAISLTLTDFGIDKDTLIVGYNLKLDKDEEFVESLFDNTKILSNSKYYSLNDNNSKELFDKVSATEYVFYKFYNIDASKLDSKINFISNITLYKQLDEGTEDVLGKFDFNVELEKDKINLSYEEYTVNDKKTVFTAVDKSRIFTDEPTQEELIEENVTYYSLPPEVEVLEVKKSNLATKLVLYLDNYTTEPSIRYYVEILDEAGNMLLENNTQTLFGGAPSDIIFKKIDLDSKIKINIYEVDIDQGSKVLSKGSIQLDLKNDLEKKKDNTVAKDHKVWKDLEFDYNADSKIYETVYDYALDSQKAYYVSISLPNAIGSKKEVTGYIEINSYQNIFNETIDDLFNNMKKLSILHFNPCHEKYTLYLDGGKNEVTLSRSDVLNIIDGKNVVIDGKEIKKEDLSTEEIEYTDIQKTTIDNREAITWLESYGESSTRKYIFLNNDDVYEISCPTSFETEQTVNDFIDSIEIN